MWGNSQYEIRYHKYLESLPLLTLRVLGRKYGAPHVSASSKDQLVRDIVAILIGDKQPVQTTKRGAPPKETYIDPEIFETLNKLKQEAEDAIAREHEREERERVVFEVQAPVKQEEYIPFFSRHVKKGLLEITPNGYGFLRAQNRRPDVSNDVFIPAPTIHALKLREGDLISCTIHPGTGTQAPAIWDLLAVNGDDVGKYENRPNFESLTAKYATEKIKLSQNSDDMGLRLLDLFVPIGKGQRALIIAPPKVGKTTLVKSIARQIESQHSELHLIVVLIDERPEEVTELRSCISGGLLFYSTFDESAEHHVQTAEFALAHAKRLAEQGKDVVLLLDSITKLTRAYNFITENTGKTMTGGLNVTAFTFPKRFFGAARNTEERGSITMLATALVETGSKMDEIIYEEFKGTGNSDIFLSRSLAERRVFPAVDLQKSSTRKEELLLSQSELEAVYKLRRHGLLSDTQAVLDMMKRTKTNEEFIEKLPEWLRLYTSK